MGSDNPSSVSQAITFFVPLLIFLGLMIFISSFIKSRKVQKDPSGDLEESEGFTPYLIPHKGDKFDFRNGPSHQTGMYIPLDVLEIRNPSGVLQAKCGHSGPETFELHFLGTGFEIKRDDKCPDCAKEYLVSHAIRCASCGLPILPGDPISRYNINGRHKPWTCYIAEEADGKETRKTVIGCLRWYCCDTGAHFAGHWTDEGFRPYFGHGGNALDECYRTKKPVIINPN